MKRLGVKKVWLGILALAISGCSGPTRFLDPEADLSYYEAVGIIPFASLSGDRAAGVRVSSIFYNELLVREFAQVREPGQFYAAIREMRPGSMIDAAWSTRELGELGEKTGVQAVFLGTVNDYGMVREGRESFPLISLEVRLVETATGRTVWSANTTRKGGPGVPLLGLGETHTLGELSAKVCRELLSTMP